MKFAPISFLIVIILASAVTFAQPTQDVKGSADHPLFTNRMPGYWIVYYQKEGFSSYSFHTKSPQTIEGKFTVIEYYLQNPNQHPGGLAIHRNYQNAVKAAGGEVLPANYPDYSIMKITRNGVEVWVEVMANSQLGYRLYIIECVPMQQVITADVIATSIDKDGFVALDIHFATGKAQILPESGQIIDEIVSLLKKRPGLRIGVEGHTDNTGNPATNKTLSEARAKAVAAAITAAGINANRLEPAGYGQERPIADNRTEEGRAKNRRVELVKR